MDPTPGRTQDRAGEAEAQDHLLALAVGPNRPDRELLERLLAEQGFQVVASSRLDETQRLTGESRPDLILLDLTGAVDAGIRALEEVRDQDAEAAVVVVVSDGADGGAAVRALDLGAVNVLFKPLDPAAIGLVLRRLRAVLEEGATMRSLAGLLRERRTLLDLPSDRRLIDPVVRFLGRELRLNYPGYEVPLTRAKLGLFEALANAVEHGNLGIGYKDKARALRQPGGVGALVARRLGRRPWRDRIVHVEARYEADRVVYTIADQGRGFRPERYQRPGDLRAEHGRGLLLIRHYMDEVEWNEAGNEIRLTLRLCPRAGKRLGNGASGERR